MTTKPLQRAVCYVDGFNLYYGMRQSNYRRYMWLDVHALAEKLAHLPHQQVAETKYFTARISGASSATPPYLVARLNGKRDRQTAYLDALQATPKISLFEGHYLDGQQTCLKCGNSWPDAEEKMTDVNIATQLLVDAFSNQFDTAIVVSADSDLVPPIDAVLSRFANKRVLVAFPPSRKSVALKRAASGAFNINKTHLKKSQLPDPVTAIAGHKIARPPEWK